MSSKRVALITGCSEPSSLGAAMAKKLLNQSVKVYATARKVEMMKELALAGCELLALDVTSEASILSVTQHITQTDGRLDILINNAGVAGASPSLDTDLDAMRQMFEVNVFGPLRLSQALAPLLLRSANDPDIPNALPGKGGKKQAVIVNIGSTAALGTPWQVAYCSSKAAMNTMSNVMRIELANLGVRVVTVVLASTKTQMLGAQKPFNLLTPSSSPNEMFIPNYRSEIQPAFEEFIAKELYNSAVPADTVAAEIVSKIFVANPPAHVWTGGKAWVMRYVMPIMPQFLKWQMYEMMGKLGLVKRPSVAELRRMGA